MRVMTPTYTSPASRGWAAKRTDAEREALRVRAVRTARTLTRVATLCASVRFAAQPREERDRCTAATTTGMS